MKEMTAQQIIDAFNAMKDEDERMEVVAELYFATYRRSISEVLGSRVVLGFQRENEVLKAKMINLEAELAELKARLKERMYPRTPAQVQTFYKNLSDEERADIRRMIKEDVFYSRLEIELSTRKERIDLLERMLDNYIAQVRKLNGS